MIQRVNAKGIYYLFPGGGVESGETPGEAAVRECWEELGVQVRLGDLVAIVEFQHTEQHYFLAQIIAGVFGTGKGKELASPADSPAGTYTPTWLELSRLLEYNVRPLELARLVASHSLTPNSGPVYIKEA